MKKRVEDLEGEFKLIKGEVKQSLSDIRELVLGGEIVPQAVSLEEKRMPPVEHLAGAVPQREPQYEQFEELMDEVLPETVGHPPLEPLLPFEQQLGDEQLTEELGSLAADDTTVPEQRREDEKPVMPAEERLPEEIKEEKMMVKENGAILQANQLPNLIRWVSVAKKEIGTPQLPTFLEAYSVRGNLSAEMKEIILHLAAVVSEQSMGPSPADVWSRLTLELHGILVDGSNR
ncbi:MAG: hypothetical protein SVP26_09445 [Chloroflexota bacterium]|nr:hypothetical protein [Chloroflexota bacterium]